MRVNKLGAHAGPGSDLAVIGSPSSLPTIGATSSRALIKATRTVRLVAATVRPDGVPDAETGWVLGDRWLVRLATEPATPVAPRLRRPALSDATVTGRAVGIPTRSATD